MTTPTDNRTIKCPACNGAGEFSDGSECQVCDASMSINYAELLEYLATQDTASYNKGYEDGKNAR